MTFSSQFCRSAFQASSSGLPAFPQVPAATHRSAQFFCFQASASCLLTSVLVFSLWLLILLQASPNLFSWKKQGSRRRVEVCKTISRDADGTLSLPPAFCFLKQDPRPAQIQRLGRKQIPLKDWQSHKAESRYWKVIHQGHKTAINLPQ